MDSQHALNAKTGKWGDASPVKEIIAQISGLVKTLDYSSLTIDELTEAGADRDTVCRKYQALTGSQPDWIQKIENMLVSLEMYRVQEEQAVKTLSELLSACGISMSEEEIRNTDTAKVQERVKKEASL